MNDCKHNVRHNVDTRIACLEDSGGFMAEIRITCGDCGKPFQFLGLEPGLDLQGARVSIDGLEANIAIAPEGAKTNPLQRMMYNIQRFDG
jgi:hypothetical protein